MGDISFMKVYFQLFFFFNKPSVYWDFPHKRKWGGTRQGTRSTFFWGLTWSSLLLHPDEWQKVIFIEQFSTRHVLNANHVQLLRKRDASIVHSSFSLLGKVRRGAKSTQFFVFTEKRGQNKMSFNLDGQICPSNGLRDTPLASFSIWHSFTRGWVNIPSLKYRMYKTLSAPEEHINCDTLWLG